MKPQTKQAHTPTPWRVMTGPNKSPLTYNGGAYFKITAEDHKESMFVYVAGNSQNVGKREFDAEFIVRATKLK